MDISSPLLRTASGAVHILGQFLPLNALSTAQSLQERQFWRTALQCAVLLVMSR